VSRQLAFALITLVAGCLAVQAPINSALGRTVGTLQAATISFTAGTVTLFALSLATGGFAHVTAHHPRWHYVAGGLLGAAYVTTALVAVRTLGAGGVVAATITGQLALSVIIDNYGLFGVTRSPITATRVAGIALLALGAYIVVRR
jgi:transporter family-2 protein